jgi:hypothetical protein
MENGLAPKQVTWVEFQMFNNFGFFYFFCVTWY